LLQVKKERLFACFKLTNGPSSFLTKKLSNGQSMHVLFSATEVASKESGVSLKILNRFSQEHNQSESDAKSILIFNRPNLNVSHGLPRINMRANRALKGSYKDMSRS
jgi:hypothetical protein